MYAIFKNVFKYNYSNEQIKVVISNALLSSITVNVLIPLFALLFLHENFNDIYILAWLFANIILSVFKVIVSKKIEKYLRIGKARYIDFYFKYYIFIIALSGLLWGLFLFFGIVYSDEIYRFFFLTIMFALTSGSIVTIGLAFHAVFLFIIFVSIPTIVAFLITASDFLHIGESLLMVSYVLVILGVVYKNKKLILKNKEQLDLLNQYHEVANKSAIVSKTDTRGIIIYVNDNFCEISGYKEYELIGKNHNIVRHPDVPKFIFKQMWNRIKVERKTWQGIIKNRAKNGDTYYVSATISPILDSDGNIKEFIALRHNITSIISDKKQLFDYLSVNKLAVLIMFQIEDYDILEKFYDKNTLETLEKNFGDNILYLIPDYCSFQRVYFLGNGQFALAKDRRSCQASQAELENMLLEFLNNVKNYIIKLDDIEYDISVICSYSYGAIQLYEDVKIGIEKALREKKEIVYADSLSMFEQEDAHKNIKTLKTLKTALEDKKIVSYFQPIVDNQTKKIVKYESLVRLINGDGRVLSPYEFLDVAKKGKYYLYITKVVLENSFKVLREVDESISINLSAIDIESYEMRKLIIRYLLQHKELASRVTFELLESEEVKDVDVVFNFIKKVKKFGVKIAIDDFGTGYSNFEKILQYEPDYIKIDGSLIKNINHNGLSKNIVETIVDFAKKQDIETIAEYVENDEIYEIIKSLGIDYSQGYAFGRPQKLISTAI